MGGVSQSLKHHKLGQKRTDVPVWEEPKASSAHGRSEAKEPAGQVRGLAAAEKRSVKPDRVQDWLFSGDTGRDFLGPWRVFSEWAELQHATCQWK